MTILGYNIRVSETCSKYSTRSICFPSPSLREKAVCGKDPDAKAFLEKCECITFEIDPEIGVFDNNCEFQFVVEPEFGFARIFRLGFVDETVDGVDRFEQEAYLKKACKSLCEQLWDYACRNAEEAIEHFEDGLMQVKISNELLGYAFDNVKVELPENTSIIVHEWISNYYVIID